MAGLMILVSVFAAGAFAKRVVTKQEIGQLQKEAVANGPGILPVQPTLALRPAAMPRVSMPVVMSMWEGGNPGKYPAKLRKDFEGLDTSPSIWMSGDDDQVGATVPDSRLEDITASWDRLEKEEKYRINVRRAYDSLLSDIPQILQLESKGKTPMDWDIYTDDLQADFPNLIDSEALGLFSAVAVKHVPSWTASIKGKDLHKAAMRELRVFIANYIEKAEVTGQDWCMDKDTDWCVLMEEVSGLDPELSTHKGDQVITSNWKMELTMNTGEMVWEDSTFPEAIVTIQGLSRFHLNDEGKIYRHSIDGCDIHLNHDITPEAAELFLVRLAMAPRAK